MTSGEDVYDEYLARVLAGLHAYRDRRFGTRPDLFEPDGDRAQRPPVFKLAAADENLFLPPQVSDGERRAIVAAIPMRARHRWFRSMRSSQALAQSVFGALAALGRLRALAGIVAEDGQPAFFTDDTGVLLQMERESTGLSELPDRPTSVDVWFGGSCRVAVECKFTEEDFGTCSRPRLKPADERYALHHCDGSYTVQRGRSDRCALSAVGIRYWQYAPRLFDWPHDRDHRPCPMAATYQLMRNVLAAAVRPDGMLVADGAHALVIYDDRNPAFRPEGAADLQWRATIAGLKRPEMLRRLSWQRLAGQLARNPELGWLTTGLREKYGILPA